MSVMEESNEHKGGFYVDSNLKATVQDDVMQAFADGSGKKHFEVMRKRKRRRVGP
jgi:hypothetical protein